MRSIGEIEAAIRKFPANEVRALARWLQAYLARKAKGGKPALPEDACAKWRGRGRLPAGTNTDEYLSLICDADGG